MKARVLAAALGGRVIGAADTEISRAVHPAEAFCEGDVAIAVSPDTIRILGESRAKIALVPENTQFPHERFQTVILMRGSRSSLPEITQVFRHRPDVQPGLIVSFATMFNSWPDRYAIAPLSPSTMLAPPPAFNVSPHEPAMIV